MLGLSWASVPLYQMLCQKFAWGGVTQDATNKKLGDLVKFRRTQRENAAKGGKDKRILVRFEARVDPSLPWDFTPVQDYVVVRPGQTALAFFQAKNRTPVPITGVSVYSVWPERAGLYFNKVQCFCFEEQRLRPNETVDMPVLFYVDPEFIKDERLTDCDEIMLAYTFFEIDSEGDEVDYDDDDDDDDDGIVKQIQSKAKRQRATVDHPFLRDNPKMYTQAVGEKALDAEGVGKGWTATRERVTKETGLAQDDAWAVVEAKASGRQV